VMTGLLNEVAGGVAQEGKRVGSRKHRGVKVRTGDHKNRRENNRGRVGSGSEEVDGWLR